MSTALSSDAHIDALEVVVDVLSGVENEAAPEAFYGRLCEAVCQVTTMDRAVIFRYDGARRRVRAAGAHGIELERFADVHVSVESAPVARRALSEDRVIEITGDFERELPPEYVGMLQGTRVACSPMVAGGLWVGVILSERSADGQALGDAERHLLWTLGKTAALAAVARIATSQSEKAKALEQRIDLAREIHERVVQRLFGVSLALSADSELDAEARARCAEEIQGALADLRAAVQRPLARAPRATQATLAEELERLASRHPDLGVVLEHGDPHTVPPELEPLAQSVLAEAVRNAHKHAKPSRVGVRIEHGDGAFVMEVSNDGIHGRSRQSGMGLRLAAFEALGAGGVVEFGKRGRDLWQVRLVVPDERG
jgi:signal transduction histidine kinase